MRRPLAALSVLSVAVVMLVGLVLIGRWEGRRSVDERNRGVERVRAAIGPLDSPRLVGYRVLPQFDCLVYREAANVFALELCAASNGSVIEAIDRRGARRHYYSFRADPADATVRVAPGRARALVRKMRTQS